MGSSSACRANHRGHRIAALDLGSTDRRTRHTARRGTDAVSGEPGQRRGARQDRRRTRLGDVGFEWTLGWHETGDRKRGFFESASAVPDRWEDVILQGPHLTVATPLVKQPNPTMRSNRDYAAD